VDKDIYINALEYGKSHLLDGVERDQFQPYMESLGYRFDNDAAKVNLNDIFNSVFGAAVGGGHAGIDKYHMDIDAYFRYIEHQELTEARRAAKQATYLAIGAIILSVLTGVFSIWQSSKPIFIADSQMNKVQELKFNAEKLELLLERLAREQELDDDEKNILLEDILKEVKYGNQPKSDAGPTDVPQ